MATMVTLTEAATFLGVSKATLRNWDNDGKLVAVRNPINGYRQYDMESLINLKNEIIGEEVQVEKQDADSKHEEAKAIKRVVNKLHCIIRDSDANSNIVTRFDEISKLLFVRLMSGRDIFESYDQKDILYGEKIQKEYVRLLNETGKIIPEGYLKINLSNEALRLCGKELYTLLLDDCKCDIKGLAYEDTIRGTFDKSDNQQYFTPYQIVEFMVKALKPFLKGTICDPACGTAGFLTKVNDFVDAKLLGFEVDERLAWVSTLNLLIHGADTFETYCMSNGGSLGVEADVYYGTIDVILTNPPFGSDYTDSKILDKYVLGKGKSSRRRGILFIEQAWNLLKEDGILAIIIDQGVLNSKTNVDVREYIFSHFIIKGIIDLPESAFLPYANVSSSIMILQKKSGKIKQGQTFFAKAEKVGRKSNGDDDIIYYPNGDFELDSDLDSILSSWYMFISGNYQLQNANCFVANVDEYLEEDKSMRLDYIFHHPYRNESKELLNNSKSPLISLSEICTERNHSYVPAADSDATSIPFTGLAHIEPFTGVATQELTPAASIKSSVKRYEPKDIVFSKMRPALRKVAVMNMNEGGYVSSECTVFTVRNDANGEPLVEPEILSTILRSDFVYGQIMSCVTGIGRPRISGKDLRKIMIPLPDKQLQIKVMQNLRANEASVKQLKDRAEALREEAKRLEIKMINEVAFTMAGGN
ncbi:MAG: N-6 DNA methylase [Eubacterium sp.]|nr:N-6 DNA methylase [Eubacterium sp.]